MTAPPAPRRAPLSRDAVLAAAEAQVAEAGLGSLSSRSLAGRLGVTPMALYRHVEDMDEVTGAVVDGLLDELGTPERSRDWRQWLEDLAQAFRSLLRQHPDALALYTRRPVTSPAARRRLHEAKAVLVDAGFTIEGATQAYAAVHTYTIGFSALAEGRRRTPTPHAELDAPDDEASVDIRAFVSEEQFVHGLRALIGGLSPADGR